jgi:hypothetical protein
MEVKMFKYLYMLWSDMILTARKNGNFTDKWKEFNYILPIFQGMNLLSLVIWLKLLFNITFPLTIPEDFIGTGFFSSAFSGILIFFLPFYLLNYFLIIRNDRYKRIIHNYKSYNGKFLYYYVLVTLLLVFIPLIWSMFQN